ncbi:MAG: restriction alleviation protein, Lar family [Armatimonadetes bacterium]|nr:restriction alleviation protein, Lar family [Armatimonadota bacterium]
MSTITKDPVMPCPFCGDDAEVYLARAGEFEEMAVFYVQCCACRARTNLKGSYEEAMASWHRRDAEDKLRFQIRKLEQVNDEDT